MVFCGVHFYVWNEDILFIWTSYLKKPSSWTFQSNFSSRPTFQTFIVLLRGLFLLQRLVDRYTSPWAVGIKFNFNVGVFASETKLSIHWLSPYNINLTSQRPTNSQRKSIKVDIETAHLWILTSLGLARQGRQFLAPRCSSEFNLTFGTFVHSLGIYWPLTVCPALF